MTVETLIKRSGRREYVALDDAAQEAYRDKVQPRGPITPKKKIVDDDCMLEVLLQDGDATPQKRRRNKQQVHAAIGKVVGSEIGILEAHSTGPGTRNLRVQLARFKMAVATKAGHGIQIASLSPETMEQALSSKQTCSPGSLIFILFPIRSHRL